MINGRSDDRSFVVMNQGTTDMEKVSQNHVTRQNNLLCALLIIKSNFSQLKSSDFNSLYKRCLLLGFVL